MTAIAARRASTAATITAVGRVASTAAVAAITAWAVIGIWLFATAGRRGIRALLPERDAAVLDSQLQALGWTPTGLLTAIVVVQGTVLVATSIVSFFIVSRRPLTLFHSGLAVFLLGFMVTGTPAGTGWRLLWPTIGPALDAAVVVASAGFFSLTAFFPSGRAVPRWAVAIPAGWALAAVTSIAIPWWTLGPAWVIPASALAIALVVSGIVVQVYRYRRVSSRTERQQTKWVVLALTVYLASTLPVLVFPPGTLQALPDAWGLVVQVVQSQLGSLLLAMVAVAIGLAIARYRLFDVDIVVSRTVVTISLIAVVVALYLALVAGAGILVGDSGPVASIAAAILVALAANPIRLRLQHRINRWMFGERGDPYGVVSRLGTELAGAQRVDAITTRVADVVTGSLRFSGAEVGVRRGDALTVTTTGAVMGEPVAELTLRSHGDEVGVLRVFARGGERVTVGDGRLLADVATQAGLALGAALSAEEVARSRERIVLAAADERQRLYRDLHDGLGPTLASVQQRIETAMAVSDDRPETGHELLAQASAQMSAMVVEVRQLVQGLRPPALSELGLVEALKRALETTDAADASTPAGTPAPTVGVTAGPVSALPAAVEVAAYRIAVEAVTNAHRHAEATRIAVSIDDTGAALVVRVDDDGRGIDPAARPGGGSRTMRERADELGGTLETIARDPRGTRVRAVLPLRGARP